LRTGDSLCADDWSCDLSSFSEIKVIATGKATHAMLRGFVQLSPDVRFTGVASAPTPPKNPVSGVAYFVGGHPLPNEQSFNAAQAALSALHTCTQNSLVVFLLSGGGSALMEFPLDPGQSLDDIRSLNQALVTCGASIEEINAVRKHVSAI